MDRDETYTEETFANANNDSDSSTSKVDVHQNTEKTDISSHTGAISAHMHATDVGKSVKGASARSSKGVTGPLQAVTLHKAPSLEGLSVRISWRISALANAREFFQVRTDTQQVYVHAYVHVRMDAAKLHG